jgi:tetratricopeptide (TPR) repeat protein
MIKKLMLLALPAIICPNSASAQAANTTPAEQPLAKPKSAIQQQFDDGTEAIAAGDWQKAFDIYAALEAKLLSKTSPSKSLSVVQLRKGLSMYRLDRLAEAESAISLALPNLSGSDASLSSDRADGYATLGNINERRFDYPAATRQFRAALKAENRSDKQVSIYSRLIQTGIFVDPDVALADADAALAIVAASPQLDKDWAGTMRYLRGRTLTNLGRLKEARADLNRAIKELGGLGTNKINLLDSVARADAAIAALRDNAPAEAQRFLAYSGAVQQAQDGFRIGSDMNPPVCGGKTGPDPTDVAVIEFNIRENGSVGYVRPVFFSGQKSAVAEFARAVSQWSWSPEDLKKIPPFFKAFARVELRCTNVFARPNETSLLVSATNLWLKGKTKETFVTTAVSDAQVLDSLRIELVRRETRFGKDSPELIELLFYLSRNAIFPYVERANFSKRAFELGVKLDAPAPVRAFLGLNSWAYLVGSFQGKARDLYHQTLLAALDEPALSADPIARSALRIAYFDALAASQRVVDGAKILQSVADDTSLPAADPYKVGALTRLASIQYSQGKIDDARLLFAKSGLSAQQCALVDARPSQTSGRLTAADYPDAAYLYGFGGWAVVEFDIDASGRTANQRPVIAWPPFVLGDAVAKGVKRFKYQQTYRPDGGLGCTAQRLSQSFRFESGF